MVSKGRKKVGVIKSLRRNKYWDMANNRNKSMQRKGIRPFETNYRMDRSKIHLGLGHTSSMLSDLLDPVIALTECPKCRLKIAEHMYCPTTGIIHSG
eukprot:gene23567-9793_t